MACAVAMMLCAPLSAGTRTVRIGVFPAAPLVSNKEKKPEGLFIDLVEYYAHERGWRIEYVDRPWSELLVCLENGEIDLLPAVGNISERDAIFDFSRHPVFIDSGVLFTSARFPIRTVFDLKGKRIAGVKGSTFTAALSNYLASFGVYCELVLEKDNPAVMEAIVDNTADAGVCIYSLGSGLAKKYPVVITAINFSPVALSFAVPKRRNADLLADINGLMESMINDPNSLYSRSFQKWILPGVKNRIPTWVWWGLGGLLCLGFFFGSWSIVLRRQVLLKTKVLEDEIAEHKRTAKELDRSEKKYRSLFSNISDAVFIHEVQPDGTHGCFIEVNEVAATYLGYSREELLHMTPLDLDVPLMQSRREHAVRETLASGRNVFEMVHVAKGGRMIPVEISSRVIDYLDRKVVLSVVRDITERKRSEAALVQTDKMHSLGMLASGMAHEINQPLMALTIAIDNLSLMIERAGPPEGALQKIGNMRGYIDRVKHIIAQVRLFSREQADDEIGDFTINDAVRNVFSLITSQYSNRTIVMSRSLSDDIPLVRGNIFKFEQVVINLLSNAAYAVELKAKSSPPSYEKEIMVRSFQEDTHAVLEIIDNGTGISEEEQKLLFTPFFTTKPVGVGTGLGLSICYGIIKAMNGEITVSSSVGRETRIRIVLPGHSYTSAKLT
ncbi:MAG: transporter substrate-binding domain-containing protein [Spirochaetota bacterium]